MSISKGNQAVKPYVGGKEVQEAYVGSQLVYRATPPYVFIGDANDYLLSDLGQLGTGCAITKYNNIYRVAPKANQVNNPSNGFIVKKDTYTLKASIVSAGVGTITLVAYDAANNGIGSTQFFPSTTEEEITIYLPDGYEHVNFIGTSAVSIYINKVIFEAEQSGLLTRNNHIAVGHVWSKQPNTTGFGIYHLQPNSNLILTIPSGFSNLNAYFDGNPNYTTIEFLDANELSLGKIICEAEWSGTNKQWNLPVGTVKIKYANTSGAYSARLPAFTLS